MFGCDPFTPRIQKVKDLPAACNSLTVQELLHKPEKKSRLGLFVIGEDGYDV